jgi:pantoate--beta-alanine ligase
MIVVNSIAELRQWREKQIGKTIGFVPTMGYLHDGHISLIKTAKQQSDVVIVSIFVNPLQFGANEDLNNYPTNLSGDILICENNGVDLIFAPNANEIYADGYPPKTIIRINELANHLCGSKRIGHFDGVCTVVAKLFNLVQPNMAFLGQKDIQQLRIIETMVSELNIPVKIIGCLTQRNKDGLALSSRNSYLSATEKSTALIVPQVLNHIVNLIKSGETNTHNLINIGIDLINQVPNSKVDYLQIVDYTYLQPIDIISGKIIIATAVFIGNTRLIDNIILEK